MPEFSSENGLVWMIFLSYLGGFLDAEIWRWSFGDMINIGGIGISGTEKTSS